MDGHTSLRITIVSHEKSGVNSSYRDCSSVGVFPPLAFGFVSRIFEISLNVAGPTNLISRLRVLILRTTFCLSE